MIFDWLRRRLGKPAPPSGGTLAVFHEKYDNFQRLQESNAELLDIISDAEEKLNGETVFGAGYLLRLATRTVFHAGRMVYSLDRLSDGRYGQLKQVWERIGADINTRLSTTRRRLPAPWVMPFDAVGRDMADVVGGKSANLGEVHGAAGLPVPAGFAITTSSFEAFLTHNNLVEAINRLKMELSDERPETLDRLSARVNDLIMSSEIPPPVAEAITSAVKDRIPPGPGGALPAVALRSSAVGEDGGEVSFAGQYSSLLGVHPDALMDGYRQVLASLFSPRAVAYRILKGIRADDIAMGVVCQQMIAARASGILFTRDPTGQRAGAMIINATWGLGTVVADGEVTPDTYWLSADAPHPVLERRLATKHRRLQWSAETGAVTASAVPQAWQNAPCLNDAQLHTLAVYGSRLETHFGSPQDVEWALDEAGALIVLQSRPLTAVHRQRSEATPPVAGHDLLAEGGDVACAGVGAGPVHVVLNDEDLNRFPENGVLAAPHSSPRLVMVMHKASAIITCAGSVTGHMASLAREFNLPTILNLPEAVTLAAPGALITVDANSGRVYRGRVEELLSEPCRRPHRMITTQMYQWLKDLTALIVPLNLTDPDSPGFSPAACRTVHDIMRLVHEVGYREMFQISDLATDRTGLSVRLDAGLPLDLYVIDLGGGITAEASGNRQITNEQVTSDPFRALLGGMTCDALIRRSPAPVNLGGFLSVFSRQMLSPPTIHTERFGEKSYAIISDKYLNFSSRVGYHFSILDTFCGPEEAKNYVNFEFKGGAADDLRRNRRARVIQRILSALGFWTQVRGDRIQARFGKQTAQKIKYVLDQLGRLVMYTRQMDMLMTDEASVDRLAACFLSGDYAMSTPAPPAAAPTDGASG
ncbi:MAG: PEP/pyruvate-binding domain-containing protein [Pseudomonadota bacterium]